MKSERSRSRSPMDDRRGSSRERSRSPRRTRIPTSKRVVVSNIPYDLKWQEVKDLFRREVGDAMYVELFNGPDGKPKGMGVIEFKDIDTAALAIDKMHRYDVKDRKLVVREERERERRQNEAMSSRGSGGGGGQGGRGMPNMGQGVMGPGPGMRMGGGGHNMNAGMGGGGPGVSPVVLQQLGIDGPVTNTVFISNLDYNVNWKKLKDVFKLAGNVVRAEIKEDKDGKSRGMGTVTFETPAEAVQAISMFNTQSLFDRTMRVKMDGQSSAASRPESLPSGLKSVGPTLNNLQMNAMDMNIGMGGSNMGMSGMGMNDGMRGMGSGMSGMGGGMSGMAGGMSGMGGGMSGMGSGMGGTSMNNSMGMGAGMSGGMGTGMGTGMGMSDSFSGMSGMTGMGSTNSSSMGMGGGLSDNFSGMSSMGMGGGSSYSGMMDSSRSSGMGSFSSGMNSRSSDYGRGTSDRSSGGGSSMASGDMRTRADKSTIIVKNLPYSVDWQTLKQKFSTVGDIRFAEISKDDRGKSQGWGLISYRREDDARMAVQKMNRVNLEGRDLVVKMLN